MARSPEQQPASGFAKRLLVVDPDQKAWGLCALLLVAQGHVVHRISHIADAPPRWPAHLYDLVVVATEDTEGPEVVEFCRKLSKLEPPVQVALLASGSPRAGLTPVIPRDRPAAEIAKRIARLLR